MLRESQENDGSLPTEVSKEMFPPGSTVKDSKGLIGTTNGYIDDKNNPNITIALNVKNIYNLESGLFEKSSGYWPIKNVVKPSLTEIDLYQLKLRIRNK